MYKTFWLCFTPASSFRPPEQGKGGTKVCMKLEQNTLAWWVVALTSATPQVSDTLRHQSQPGFYRWVHPIGRRGPNTHRPEHLYHWRTAATKARSGRGRPEKGVGEEKDRAGLSLRWHGAGLSLSTLTPKEKGHLDQLAERCLNVRKVQGEKPEKEVPFSHQHGIQSTQRWIQIDWAAMDF